LYFVKLRGLTTKSNSTPHRFLPFYFTTYLLMNILFNPYFVSTQNRLLGLCDTMETLHPPSPPSHPKLETNIHVEVAHSSGGACVDEGDDSLWGALWLEPHSSITVIPTTTSTKIIESPDFPLASINNIHSGNHLSPSMCSVYVTTLQIKFSRKFLRTLRVFS